MVLTCVMNYTIDVKSIYFTITHTTPPITTNIPSDYYILLLTSVCPKVNQYAFLKLAIAAISTQWRI
jgi:hypothetical protein